MADKTAAADFSAAVGRFARCASGGRGGYSAFTPIEPGTESALAIDSPLPFKEGGTHV
jgi:hypothetical protein